MTIIFEPRIDLPVGAQLPDSYVADGTNRPPSDFVVTRHRNGTPASRFGDSVWDMSAYHPEMRASLLRFTYWTGEELTHARELLSADARWIMFSMMWFRQGPTLSVNTLQNYMIVIKALAYYCDQESCKFSEVLSSATYMTQFIESGPLNGSTEILGALLTSLSRIDPLVLGFDIVGSKLQAQLREKIRTYRAAVKQNAPIPSRIYSFLISNLLKELNEWQSVATELLTLASSCAKDPCYGRSRDQQAFTCKKLGLTGARRPQFEEIISAAGMAFLVQRGHILDVRGLSRAASEAQMVAKLIVQVFTGMRDDEAQSLPYFCLDTTTSNGATHCVVLGRTTKFNNGRIKRTRWVTNREGQGAITAARQIAVSVYSMLGVEAHKDAGRTNDFPLFPSFAHMGLSGSAPDTNKKGIQTGLLKMSIFVTLRERIQPVIEDADICELERIDPHRAWRSEQQYQVSRQWTFTSHQLRRSLALYAQRSGLVSLPSLRRQLQHITEEMSRYYARGSAYANDFIGNDRTHFGAEWQQAQPESAAISYIVNVLMSDEVLFGGHANWVQHRLKDETGAILISRENTLKKFKKGEIAYRETLIGGCTSVGPCDQTALDWLHIGCIGNGCRNLVGNAAKLERVIKAQEQFVLSLDQQSVEFRTEKADLAVLVATRDRVIQQNMDRESNGDTIVG